MQLNVLDDLAEAMKALDGKKILCQGEDDSLEHL
jgi:SpoU rRNA methylase family enzyme